MRRVGVTGAAGFIGSHLCERLVKEGCEVVGVDDLSYGSIANLQPILGNPKFTFEVLDCTRRRSLRAAFDGCDAIAHLAAKKIPRFGGVVSTLETNVAGANVACGVALQLGADLVITSTSDVYGNAEPPFAEDGTLVLGPPTSKRWSYAVSKMYDEHLALALAEERGLKVTVLRLFNAYGPRNHLSWWGGPLVTFIEALLDGEQLEIHGDGHQTRTFTYVSDTVDGFVRALRKPEGARRGHQRRRDGDALDPGARDPGAGAPGDPDAAAGEASSRTPTSPGNYQDVRHRVPDTTKAKALLGFEAKVGLAQGLAKTVAWHRAQRGEERVAARR